VPRGLAFLLTLAFLSGCSLLSPPQKKPPQASQAAEWVSFAPPLGPARRIVQEITAKWQDRQKTLLCVLELDKRHIAIAGLSGDGISLFNINYDGKKVDMDKSPLLPSGFSPEFMVKDLQLAYWPLAELQKRLPKHWRLEADGKQRRLYFNEDKYVDVDYLQPDPNWAKSIRLTNHRYHYQLLITTISYETVPE
jgi:Protein of unknown function (DUF3261)